MNKAKKIRQKDLINRYVVSGLRTLGKVAEWQQGQSEAYGAELLTGLNNVNQEVRQKVLKHLSDTKLVSDIE